MHKCESFTACDLQRKDKQRFSYATSWRKTRAFPWVQMWVESRAVRFSTRIVRLLWQQKMNKIDCVLTLTCATALPCAISLDAHRRPCILFSLIEYLHWQKPRIGHFISTSFEAYAPRQPNELLLQNGVNDFLSLHCEPVLNRGAWRSFMRITCVLLL